MTIGGMKNTLVTQALTSATNTSSGPSRASMSAKNKELSRTLISLENLLIF